MNKTVSIIAILVILGGAAWYLAAHTKSDMAEDTTGSSQTDQTADQTTDQSTDQSMTGDTTGTTTGTSATTTNTNTTNTMDKVKIEVLKQGTGAAAKAGDTVEVNYVGTLTNGTKFDASADHGGTFSFKLGDNSVIQGWEEGVLGMKVGEKIKLTIPPSLGYGAQAIGAIPANSTLVFEITLVSIK